MGKCRFYLLLITIFVASSLFSYHSYAQYGNSKIVVEESVLDIRPPYTYEYYFGTTITPYTVSRGMYNLNFIIYSGGSLLTKVYVGLWDFLTLGLLEDIQGIVGSGEVSATIPLATLKIRVLDEYKGMSLAIVFDNFSYGENSRAFNPDYYSKILYGVIIPFSIKYRSIFNYSYIVIGYRFPFVPFADASVLNSSFFISTDLQFSQFLKLFFGVDNIIPLADKITNSFVFAEVKFLPVRSLGISLVFTYSFKPSFERMLKLEYIDRLF